MGEKDIQSLIRDMTAIRSHVERIELNTDRIEQKMTRIEERTEGLAQANARHSERLKTVENSVDLAHTRVSDVKVQISAGTKKIIGALTAFCGATIAIIWNMVKDAIGK